MGKNFLEILEKMNGLYKAIIEEKTTDIKDLNLEDFKTDCQIIVDGTVNYIEDIFSEIESLLIDYAEKTHSDKTIEITSELIDKNYFKNGYRVLKSIATKVGELRVKALEELISTESCKEKEEALRELSKDTEMLKQITEIRIKKVDEIK